MQTQNLTLDFCQNSYKTVMVKQYDRDSRHLLITCTDNGSVYKLDASTHECNVKMNTPDDRAIYNPTTINKDGTVLITFTESMLYASGVGELEIQVVEKPTRHILSSMILTVRIIGSVYSDEKIIASDEFVALNKALEEVQECIEKTEEVVEKAENTIERMETLKKNVEDAEAIRVSKETERQANEASRISAENNRASAESKRVSAENTRVSNEKTRVSAETARVNAENSRADAEAKRASNENERVANENERKANETTRQNNEQSIKNAEVQRQNNEAIRIENENARIEAESNRANEETKRQNAESARSSAESVRAANETERNNNESLRRANELLRESAEENRETAEGKRQAVYTEVMDKVNGFEDDLNAEIERSKSAENKALTDANAYTDKEIANLVGAAPELLNTIEELAQAIENHQDVTDALNEAIAKKANTSDLTSHVNNTSVHYSLSSGNNVTLTPNSSGNQITISAVLGDITDAKIVTALPSDAASHPNTLYIIAE